MSLQCHPKSQDQLKPQSLVGSTVLSRFFWMDIAMPVPTPTQLGDGLMSHIGKIKLEKYGQQSV